MRLSAIMQAKPQKAGKLSITTHKQFCHSPMAASLKPSESFEIHVKAMVRKLVGGIALPFRLILCRCQCRSHSCDKFNKKRRKWERNRCLSRLVTITSLAVCWINKTTFNFVVRKSSLPLRRLWSRSSLFGFLIVVSWRLDEAPDNGVK